MHPGFKFALKIVAKVQSLSRRVSASHRKAFRFQQQMRANFYERLWEETVRNIQGVKVSLPGGFIKITIDGRSTYVRGSAVCLDNYLSLKLAGNKPLINRILTDEGLTTPLPFRSYSIVSIERAIEFRTQASGPLVIKPAAGTGAGNGVTTNVSSMKQLILASVRASGHANELLVEEQAVGRNYRLLYLGGELLDVIERQSPTVTGNGKHSIATLIAAENQLRIDAAGARASSLIRNDLEMRICLKKQGLSMGSIPAIDERVLIKYVVNQNNLTENIGLANTVHPSFELLGEKIARLLQLELVGIDVITPDIQRDITQQQFFVNDVNTTPGLHHHYLVTEGTQSRNVAAEILAYVLSRQQRQPSRPEALQQ